MKNSEETIRKSEDGTGRLRAGVAKSEITTQKSGVRILDPLFAKVLVLASDETTVVIITMDAVAIGGICDISDTFLPRLREHIECQLGLPGQQVMVNASHTHPPGEILCEEEVLLERTFDAVRRAWEDLVEVTVGAGAGFEKRITMNRNLRLADGRHWTIRHANPSPPDEAIVGVGPFDPEIGILRIDRRDGTPLAVVYNFACHLLFGDALGSVTANFPAVASRIIEEHCGGEAMAFFVQGAAGDVIDVGFKDFHRPREVESIGTKLGLAVLKGWRNISTGPSILKIVAESVELPRRSDLGTRIAALEKKQRELVASLRFTSLHFRDFLDLYLRHLHHADFSTGSAYHYLWEAARGDESRSQMDRFNEQNLRKYLENIRAMEQITKLCDDIATLRRHEKINQESGSQTINAEIQGIRIGNAVMIAAPLEVLTEVALRIKAASPYRHTWIAGFSNGYMHYGAPAADYDKGGYEVTECFLAPEWQALFESKVQEILVSDRISA